MALLTLSMTFAMITSAEAQDWSLRENPELVAYFESEVKKLEQQNELSQFQSAAEWNEAKPKLREQLFDMLGLNPLPAKTPLQPVVEGTTEEAEFVVERVHYQSMPGLYVTGNFYRPKNADKPLPTILYVCGHGQVKKDGVSYGNKTHYHYHGSWFARNGYNCLIIDTLQLGDIHRPESKRGTVFGRWIILRLVRKWMRPELASQVGPVAVPTAGGSPHLMNAFAVLFLSLELRHCAIMW
jgi:hypothetical protein